MTTPGFSAFRQCVTRALSAVVLSLLVLMTTACYEVGSPLPRGDIRDVAALIGEPAAANPLPVPFMPEHPFLAPQGRSGMHSDPHISQTYPWSGPLGHNPEVLSASFGLFGGECATVVIDSQGRLITVCTDFLNMRLLLLDPDTLGVLATHDLPLRASNKTLNLEKIMNDTSGGAYFHLDDLDRPIIANAANHIQVFSLTGAADTLTWQVDIDIDLNPHLQSGAQVTAAIPDWQGNLWFVTRQGVVGVVHVDTHEVSTYPLPGEEIQNAMAVAEEGVYVTSDHALYRFHLDQTGLPAYVWRQPYDRGTAPKPGAIGQGSGTTASLMDNGLVAIADNADGRVNVVVYRRDDQVDQRELCRVPVFQEGVSVTENSLIVYGRSIIIENNFGYTNPFANPWTEPGLVRVDVRADMSGCDVVWESQEASQTTVPKLALGNGLIYLYTREPQPDPARQAWYLTAVDFRTGTTRFKILMGLGRNWNNNWAPITLAPDGTAYVGVLRGIIAVRDAGPNKRDN